jgi:two-component system sensor histidine kinase DegS
LAATQAEYEQISAELQEVRGAVRAMSLSFDQANLQRVESAAHVREMEEHMETFSRQEIRARYLESARAEMRAFMLVQERERLQDKEQAFARHQESLRHAVEVLSTLPLGAPGAPAPLVERVAGTPDRPAALGRSIQAEEDVRQRVARHLHDGPAQALANVVLTAEVCEKLVQSDPARARSELGTLKGHVGTALQDIRKFIFELRPMTLDDLGLVPTLRRYIGDLGARYRIQIVLAVPNGERRLAPPAELALFRIGQEAISNAVEHSQATLVRLTLALGSDALVLTVEDNGVGFDVEQALASAAARRTFGLASMQERAESLGGWLRIESAFGQGSRVEVRVPAR